MKQKGPPIIEREILVQAGDAALAGNLSMPDRPRGIIIFAHGSGSSRFSSRNRQVAEMLQQAQFATLLFDLLSENEDRIDQFTREYRFDIPMLGARLRATVDWVGGSQETQGLPIGLFGASTGAAAALIAAADRPQQVGAVVSRGGRPDLAGEALPRVTAPTLFIVGGLDATVLELNRDAASQMTTAPEIRIVPGASHLFEEPGKLRDAAAIAREFFQRHLGDGKAE